MQTKDLKYRQRLMELLVANGGQHDLFEMENGNGKMKRVCAAKIWSIGRETREGVCRWIRQRPPMQASLPLHTHVPFFHFHFHFQ